MVYQDMFWTTVMEGGYTAVMSFDRSTKRIWSAHRGSSINRKTRRLQVGCLLCRSLSHPEPVLASSV